MKSEAEDGLSLYIEFNDRKILFDTGQSDLFIKNAIKMGVDLSAVDYLIVSQRSNTGNTTLKAVFGGLHLYNPISRKSENASYFDNLIGYYSGLTGKVYTLSGIFVLNNLVCIPA